MAISQNTLFEILVATARNKAVITYKELSDAYHKSTGFWHEPHGTWDIPLGELNNSLHAMGLPPLSAVVVLAETQELGGLFWGSSQNTPSRPSNQLARTLEYAKILGMVHATQWPDSLP